VPYIPLTAQDEKEMLKVIGVQSVDDLFADVPPSMILKNGLNLPAGMSEPELKRFFRKAAQNNEPVTDRPCFLGAGVYYHDLPSCVKAMVMRPEFLTSYTPYQPEISQGTLQVLFDFQTYMPKLTGLEVSNASLYDGATAVTEAVLMALRLKHGTDVFCSRALHPEYLETLKTISAPRNAKIHSIPLKGTVTDLEALKASLTPNAVVVIQYPNFLGSVEDLKGFADACHAKGAYLVVAGDAAYLRSLYPGITILGDFGKSLSHSGDTLVLDDPAPAFSEMRQLVSAWLTPRLNKIPLVRGEMRRRAERAIRSAHRVLFLCRGNICRSPFAEYALRLAAGDAVECASAGSYPVAGRRSPEAAIEAARRLGVELGHCFAGYGSSPKS